MDALDAFAGQSTHAAALIHAAREGTLRGAEIDRHLFDHAQPCLFTAGRAQAVWLFSELEDAVARWVRFDSDPATLPEWTAEEVDAEVLKVLFELLTGRPACRGCLNAYLIDVDGLEPAGSCSFHNAVMAA